MDDGARLTVRRRAGDACEYCRLPQAAQPWARFHVDHIRARQHGGGDDLGNLCLSCSHCNWSKGPNLASVDEITGEVTPLFDPRTDVREQHFSTSEHLILGVTPTGRATVSLLKMNSPDRVRLRIEFARESER